MSLIGFASHNAGDPADDHPSVTNWALRGDHGELSPVLRDNGVIRVKANNYVSLVDAAISRWNASFNYTIFVRVTSGEVNLTIRNRVQGECDQLGGFNAFWLTDIPACGIRGDGDPEYEHDTPSFILLGSGFPLLGSDEIRTIGLVHEMGHDLGLADHYVLPQTPVCRTDVASIMEDWGCSGGTPTQHDFDDVEQAYKMAGRPHHNYVWAVNAIWGEFRADTGPDQPAESLHNEQKTAGLRVRQKSSLEGSVVFTKYWDRQSTNSYNASFALAFGEQCLSANGRSQAWPGEGADGPEACVDKKFVGSGYAVGTADTRIDSGLDYFRLYNFTWLTTITNARLTYLNGNFISWVTQYGQPTGQIITNGNGRAYSLDLPKGNYRFNFDIEGSSFTITIGLDDEELP